jgi:Chalcone isomerase-like
MKILLRLPIAHYLIAACAAFPWASSAFASQNAPAQAAQTQAEQTQTSELARQLNTNLGSPLERTRLLGSTRLSMYGFQIYDARLWAEPGFKADDYLASRFALEITYLRKLNGKMVAQRSIKEMQGVGNLNPVKSAQWLAQMENLFPNIAKGDRLVGIHQPGAGAVFTFNGKPLGEVKDAEFARLFFGIWLSPQTSAPQMRRELLGLALGTASASGPSSSLAKP